MSTPAAAPSRRQMTGRPADTVTSLVEAAVSEVNETGFDRLTIRNVAQRAGVSPATAYTYFASKEHLLTEVFWRLLDALPMPAVDRRRSAANRVGDAMRGVAMLVADQPELAAGVTTAMLAHDPDVKVLRDRIGSVFVTRIEHALGKDTKPQLLPVLIVTFTGAMLTAGMGNMRYDEIGDLMVAATQLMTERAR